MLPKEKTQAVTDTVTVLTCHKNLNLTKIYSAEGVKAYDEAAAFAVSEVAVDGIRALSAELGKLVGLPNKCIVRGAFVGEARAVDLLPPKRPGMFARRMALFPDVPRHWLQLDIDKFKPGDGFDPVGRPVEAIDKFIGEKLPAVFHGVTYHWMLTSSAGMAPGVLKCRLTFWLDEAYSSEHLRAWAETEGLAVDKALFHPIQIHYTAAPLFKEGTRDPVPVRWGLEEGMLGDSVDLRIDPLSVLKPDAVVRSLNKDMPDARAKHGWIGAFCRAYDAEAAINEFLYEVFEWQGEGNARRLNFLLSASGAPGGAFITDDGCHVVNKHDSDPFNNRAANSFDLVRWYRFGHLDSEAQAKDLVTGRPSYKAMVAWCQELEPVKLAAMSEGAEAAEGLFEDLSGGEEEEARDWRLEIERNDRAQALVTMKNLSLCVLNLLPGLYWNEFALRLEVEGNLPWRKTRDGIWNGDADLAALRMWLEERVVWQGNISTDMLVMVLSLLEHARTRHPLRAWLKQLVWDGVGRIDSLLIRCAGAPDTSYVRETMRKWLVAAVARIMEPGIKFDHILTLIGDQGLRKSTFFAVLGGEYFADDAPSMSANDGKAFKEWLAGKWIVELAEMSASKRADEDHVKAVITSRVDSYRPAYGRAVRAVPRQCIFGATTNNDTPYKDRTGGRRNWPVKVTQTIDTGLVRDEREQLLAEAVALWAAGEELFLSPETEAEAREIQEAFTNDSGVGEAASVIAAWLDGGADEYGEEQPAINQISAIEIAESCTGLRVFSNWGDKRALALEAMRLIVKAGAWEKYPYAQFTKKHGKQKVWKRKGTWAHREKR